MERLRVVISGRVQGVGFRYSTAREARRRGLAGWVRNCCDGSVEAEFDGPRNILEDMLAWCRSGPTFARVQNVSVDWLDAERPHDEFRIEG